MLLGMGNHLMRLQQQSKNHHRRPRAAEETRFEPSEHGSAAENLKHDLDEVLDQIDSVLEENAGGFAQGTVAKGDV
jgi:ubiquitin-like protein Pup